jgi:hypothetical protein
MQRLNTGELKIKVEMVFLGDMQSGGWGAVIINENGLVVACGAGKLTNLADPPYTKIMTAVHGARITGQNRFLQIHPVFFSESRDREEGSESIS